MQKGKYQWVIALLFALTYFSICPPLALCAETEPNLFQGKVYNLLNYPVHTIFAGEVAEKMVQVGQYVKKGDTLLKVNLQESDLYNLEKRLDKEQAILNSQLNIERLQHELKLLEEKKEESNQLFSSGMASAQAVQEGKDAIDFSKLEIEHYEKQLVKIKQDLKRERVLISDWLGQKVYKKIPRYSLVKAPASGYIVWENENIKTGSFASGHIFTIGAMDPMIVRTQMYEADTFHLKLGGKAKIILEFADNKVMPATIKSIAWVPLDRNIASPSYYIVELEVANPDNILKEGYRVKVSFPEI